MLTLLSSVAVKSRHSMTLRTLAVRRSVTITELIASVEDPSQETVPRPVFNGSFGLDYYSTLSQTD